MRKATAFLRFLSLLCVILILSLSFVPFVTHNHEENEMDCAFCHLLDVSHDLCIETVGIFAVLHVAILFLHTYLCFFSEKDRTLVGQKVKLSN